MVLSARHLVVGFDGADLDVIEALGSSQLPTLHRLMGSGAYAALRSVQPPATLPNWVTFLTGVDPARHGVFDFTTRDGYAVRFTAGTVREAPTLFEALDALGKRTACIAFPGTYPPPRLEHGVFISGWDAPVAFEADRTFMWPPSLYESLRERFGPWRFDDVDEMNTDAPGWHAQLPRLLVDRVRRKTEVARFLLQREQWDAFAVYFGESDTAAHHLWALHDPRSPRSPSFTPIDAEVRQGLATVYTALDSALQQLLDASGPTTELTVVSDHGSGGSSDVVLYLNRALHAAGLLDFAQAHSPWRAQLGRAVSWSKDLALTKLPPRLRERLFRAWGARLPGWLESRARFGAIAMERTRAFSDELNYFPGVWLNLEGREPLGTVSPAMRDATAREVERALLELRDPFTGEQVVDTVWRREELFEGPHLDRAPDLLIRFRLRGEGRDGYSYNLQPSGEPGPVWRRLTPEEHLGRKGRSLQGSHRERGFYLANGPRVRAVGRVDAHIADAAATWLARMDVTPPVDAAGRVLFEVLSSDAGGHATSLPTVSTQRARSSGDESQVEKRLRALGYVD